MIDNAENDSDDETGITDRELSLMLSMLRDDVSPSRLRGYFGGKWRPAYYPSESLHVGALEPLATGFLPSRYSGQKKRFLTGALEPLSSGFIKKGFNTGMTEVWLLHDHNDDNAIVRHMLQ